MKRRIVRRSSLQVDGFTYGDWRQYVAFLDDGTAICCRISTLPATLAIVGFALLTMAACGVLMLASGIPVYSWRVAGCAFLGFALAGPWAVTWFTDWRLVVPVSEPMQRREDGSYWRNI